mmetsp:Transcript_4618/g.13063  ORF Transcript_4618/g.13063 Transcript_4618/m.13063 type:complete len:292 (-) Transcript_4618:486-1361(-)
MDAENISCPSPPFSPGSYVPFGAERRPLRPHNTELRRRVGQIAKPSNCNDAPKAAKPATTTREDLLLSSLRTECSARYNETEHEQMLHDLWTCVRFGDLKSFRVISPCWRSLGFQQDDPTTDLRGCGVIGLRQLLHFCERGGNDIVGSMDFAVAPFPLAAASFSCTLALCSHLHLLPHAASSRPPCAQHVLSSFLQLASELEPAHALDLLHAELLRGLAELWSSMQQPGLTLMHFPQVRCFTALVFHVRGDFLLNDAPVQATVWRWQGAPLPLDCKALGSSSLHTSTFYRR